MPARRLPRALAAACLALTGLPAAAGEGRILRTEVLVSAPVSEVWKAFTTVDGATRWMVAFARIDFRLGGTYETSYSRDAKPGDPNNIRLHILGYEPERMLAFNFTAPPNVPRLKIAEKTWTVVRFEPVTSGKTRVTETMVGWGEGPEWDHAYQHFEKGNAWTLEKLVALFERREDAARRDEAMRLLRGLAGSEWRASFEGPSGRMEGRVVFEELFGGKFVLARGFLGAAGRLEPHAHMIVGRHPLTDALHVWNWDPAGAVTSGAARLEGSDRLVVDWDTVTAGGKRAEYRVEYHLLDADTYRTRIFQNVPGGEPKLMIELLYRRSKTQESGDR